MQPARKMLLVFQGFVRDLTLVNTHATQLNLFFFILLFHGLMVIFCKALSTVIAS